MQWGSLGALGAVILLVSSLAFAGCSLERGALAPGPDAGVGLDARVRSDGGRDVTIGTRPDAAVDARPDAAVDAPPDAADDAAPDAAAADATADTGVVSGGECTTGCGSCPDYSPCGSRRRCFGGECVARCPVHDDGTVSCRTLCGWCRGDCVFTWSDRDTGESCDAEDTPAWCYCRWR